MPWESSIFPLVLRLLVVAVVSPDMLAVDHEYPRGLDGSGMVINESRCGT